MVEEKSQSPKPRVVIFATVPPETKDKVKDLVHFFGYSNMSDVVTAAVNQLYNVEQEKDHPRPVR